MRMAYKKKPHIIYTHMQVCMCTHNPPRSDLRGPIIFDPLLEDGLLTLKDLCSESTVLVGTRIKGNASNIGFD